MEVGGRAAMASFRRPLAEGRSVDLDLEALEPEENNNSMFVRCSSGSQEPASKSSRLTSNVSRPVSYSSGSERYRSYSAGEAAAAAAAAASGRRLQTGAAAFRRAATPLRAAAEARRALQRSLKADGECFAVCMAGGLDIVKLSKAMVALTEAGRAGTAAAFGRRGGSGLLPSGSSELPSSQCVARDPSVASAISNGQGSEAEGSLEGLGGAAVAAYFGQGDNTVLQLKLFRGKDMFAFGFGCIVCWGFDLKEQERIIDRLRPFLIRPLPKDDVEEEQLEFVMHRQREVDEEEDDEHVDDYNDETEDGKKFGIRQDQIILSTSSNVERLAYSYALAQSVRLGSFEKVVDRSIASTRSIPETMAETGEVHLQARDLSKQMGGLLVLRCDVNLHTDILETPDVLWDEDKFEPCYVSCRGYLDIDKRVDILNQRLVVLKDLYDLLQNSVNVKHGTKLEWIVIVLILVEVFLEILELFHDSS